MINRYIRAANCLLTGDITVEQDTINHTAYGHSFASAGRRRLLLGDVPAEEFVFWLQEYTKKVSEMQEEYFALKNSIQFERK